MDVEERHRGREPGGDGKQLGGKEQGDEGNEGEGGRARRELTLGRECPGPGQGISFRWV